jgi:hypothetical protein
MRQELAARLQAALAELALASTQAQIAAANSFCTDIPNGKPIRFANAHTLAP